MHLTNPRNAGRKWRMLSTERFLLTVGHAVCVILRHQDVNTFADPLLPQKAHLLTCSVHTPDFKGVDRGRRLAVTDIQICIVPRYYSRPEDSPTVCKHSSLLLLTSGNVRFAISLLPRSSAVIDHQLVPKSTTAWRITTIAT